jgi:hypothetical protein
VVGPEAALPRLEVVADPGPGQLEARDRLEVAGDQGEPEVGLPAGQLPQQLDDPGRHPLGEVGRAQLAECLDGGRLHLAPAHVEVLRGHAGGGEQVADDRAVRAPRRFDPLAVRQRHAVHPLRRLPQRAGMFHRGPLEQRAVDVEEEQEGAQRLRSRPGSRRRAKAAISFAAFSTSSSWTISTGECM